MQVNIANCHKGRDGYDGAVVELPTSHFMLEDALQRAKVSKDGSYQLQRFIDWPGFLVGYLATSGNKTLEEINLLAKKVSQMNEIQLNTYEGALLLRNDENIDLPISTKELINYAYNLDSFEFYPGVVEDRDLGDIAMRGMFDIVEGLPDEVMELLDARKVGEALRRDDLGAFTKSGYIVRSSVNWQEIYDGIHLPEQPEIHSMISLWLESVNKEPEENGGIWLELPADEKVMRWALDSLGETSLDGCVIAEAESILPALKYQLAADEDINKLNLLAQRLATFSDSSTLMKYKAVLELECFPDINRMLDITQNLDCYDDPQTIATADYTKYLLREAGFDINDPAFDRFDFAGYGERSLEQAGYVSTSYGTISRNEKPFVQEYTKPESGMNMH